MNAAQNPHNSYHGSSQFSSTLTLGRSSSVLGYCLLPLVFASLLGVLLPLDSFVGYCLVSTAIAWCTYSSSAMFCVVGRMANMRVLVAYPLALFYVGFGMYRLNYVISLRQNLIISDTHRHYGDIQQQRDGSHRCDEGRPLSVNEISMAACLRSSIA